MASDSSATPSSPAGSGAERRWELLRGTPGPPAAVRQLRAGPVTALLDGADLRRLCFGDVELVRRIGLAVRDERWGTVEGVLEHCEVEAGSGSFAVALAAHHRSEALDVRWEGRIEGRADGTVEYRIAWTAGTDFDFNRIGLVVLHPPATCAGRQFRARTRDGGVEGLLDRRIAPQPFADGRFHALFEPFDELRLDLDEGELAFGFAGELFEMEDHRNWTDASFKTYGTPLARPLPQHAVAGARHEQSVRVTLDAGASTQAAAKPAGVEGGAPGSAAIGSVGVVHSGHLPLDEAAAQALRAARLGHLRVDVDLDDTGRLDVLRSGLGASRRLGCPVELALHVTPATVERLPSVLAEALDADVTRVLGLPGRVGPAGPWASTRTWLTTAMLAAMNDVGMDVPLVGGTSLSFAELNRMRPDAGGLAGVCYGFNPQVHGSDEVTLVENLQAQAETVASARALAGGRPVFVGPVTLAPWAPRGTSPATAPAAAADPRQASLLGAGWTLGTLASLFTAGARAVTLYETLGPRGVVVADGVSFVQPLFHVLADVAELAGASVIDPRRAGSGEVRAGLLHPERGGAGDVVALAVEGTDGDHLLVANLTAAPRRWGPIRSAGVARMRRLNEHTAPAALRAPGEWRRAWPAAHTGDGDLELAPYEYVRVEGDGMLSYQSCDD